LKDKELGKLNDTLEVYTKSLMEAEPADSALRAVIGSLGLNLSTAMPGTFSLLIIMILISKGT
jgi:hypothetical protein